MRAVACLCAMIVALGTATPAPAQEEFSAEDRIAIERMFGGHIDNALDLCLTDAAPDVAAMEARAAAAGWPPFENVGRWRVARVPGGGEAILSFGLYVEPVADAPIPGTAFTCTLLMPAELSSMLRGHVADRFNTEHGLGAFHLEDGSLRAVANDAWPEGGVQELFAQTPPQQRLVLLTIEEPADGVAVKVTVLHRAQ